MPWISPPTLRSILSQTALTIFSKSTGFSKYRRVLMDLMVEAISPVSKAVMAIRGSLG